MSDAYVKQMHTKLEMTREQMKYFKETAERAKDRQMEQNRKLYDTLRELTSFKEEEAAQKDVLEILGKGLEAFGKMKTQWTELLIFFQNISNLMETSLGPVLEQFVERVEVARDSKLSIEGTISEGSRNRLYQTAFEASKVSYVVHQISSSYEKISQNHLMPLVSSFGELIALDMERDRKKIEDKREKLQFDALKIQEAIKDTIEEGHNIFRVKIANRQENLDKVFTKYLPELDAQVKLEIKSTCGETMKKVNRQNNSHVEVDEDEDTNNFI